MEERKQKKKNKERKNKRKKRKIGNRCFLEGREGKNRGETKIIKKKKNTCLPSVPVSREKRTTVEGGVARE